MKDLDYDVLDMLEEVKEDIDASYSLKIDDDSDVIEFDMEGYDLLTLLEKRPELISDKDIVGLEKWLMVRGIDYYIRPSNEVAKFMYKIIEKIL